MRKLRFLVTLALLGTPLAPLAFAQDGPVRFDAQRARVYRSEGPQKLTAAAKAEPAAALAGYLRSLGRGDATLRTLVSRAPTEPGADGIRHVRIEQEVGGLHVYGAYAQASFDAQGRMVHMIDNLAEAPARGVVPATATSRQALASALRHLYPRLRARLPRVRAQADTVYYAKGSFFHAQPSVRRMAVAMADGSMQEGFLVETWSEKKNLLHHTLVGADGRVLNVELRTVSDSYNVFPNDPDKTPQQVVAGPGAGNAQSPSGWLSGTQSTVRIAGNNASAYLDTDNNGAPDAGGTAVADGNFLAAADLTASPGTSANKEVAVQNLFYLNNWLHDELYKHGFVEKTAKSGNFQENNFGLGGLGSDSVNAEAQDGGGTDNANFSTPADGSNPRMQMYLWTAKGLYQVAVNSPAGIAGNYRANGAEFGPALNATGVTGNVVLAADGTAPASDGCQAFTNGAQIAGNIALIDRGTCDFVTKVKNAQLAGAIGAIVANNAGDSLLTMGGTDGTINIPSVFIGQTDGGTIKSGLGQGVNATERLADPPPPMRDGDLDSDIVFHEYGHGLTWRMIGSMSGAMSGAIGEGMSDVLAILINGDDRVGEYSWGDASGIRRYPYTNYPLTYSGFSGAAVHNDGEIYAAIGWRLGEIFQRENISRDTLLGYLVDGMNYTPSAPAFEHMRDGILQSVANRNPAHKCFVWEGFAAYGVGVGAKATVNRRGQWSITESFQVPAECSGGGGCTPTQNPETSCADGQDNDCDGLTDAADPDCQTSCKPKGASCTANSECCSNKCGGKAGSKTCK